MARILSLFTIVALAAVSAAPIAEIPSMNNAGVVKRSEAYSGTATYFIPEDQGGSTGACGPQEDVNSNIVAINAPQYGSMSGVSDWCGQEIEISGPAGTTTAVVNDACPECAYGSLDLTPAVYDQVVGDFDAGEADITWTVV
jgi:expansin (peptidoglycan-binding protein)